jgi:hypothetical protein
LVSLVENAYKPFKEMIGRTLLLGSEFLVAAESRVIERLSREITGAIKALPRQS